MKKSKYLLAMAVAAMVTSYSVQAEGVSTINQDQNIDTMTTGALNVNGGAVAVKTLNSQETLAENRGAFIKVAGNGQLEVGHGTIIASPEKGQVKGALAYVPNGILQIGRDANLTNEESHLTGDIVVGDVSGNGDGKTAIADIGLQNKSSVWTGFALNNVGDKGEINLYLDKGEWDHFYQGSEEVDKTPFSSERASHINRLVGTQERNYDSAISQSEDNPIYINHLQGHANFFFTHTDWETKQVLDGQKASDFQGGDVYIASATGGAGAHVYTSSKGIDTNDTMKTANALNNLASKLHYTSYTTGERNLVGTVTLASSGANPEVWSEVVSANGVKEGNITWKADGQGSYVENTVTPEPEVKPEPTPEVKPDSTPEVKPNPTPAKPSEEAKENETVVPHRGSSDTEHMQGARSAILSNVGAWRMLSSNSYRLRYIEQGESLGMWAHLGGGRYEYDAQGLDFTSKYSHFQGGYDTKMSDWILGGQVEYLRGTNDFVYGGSGKERAFSVGAYAQKDLGAKTYVQLESKVGRVSNDFTAYNKIGEADRGKTKANAYSLAARVGKRIDVGTFYVEPQAELRYIRLGSDSFSTDAMTVNYDAVASTSGAMHLEIGKVVGLGSLYTRLSVGRDFTGKLGTHYTSGNTHAYTATDLNGVWSALAFGGRYGLASDTSLFADVATGLSGDYQAKWDVNAGVTHRF